VSGFWGRFVDGNVLAAKTPRLSRPYEVTAEQFGRRGYKPPISANAVFMRDLYDQTPLDVTWFYGYEDYEWFWRVARAGHRILFSGDLTAAHHHRRSYRDLMREYARSSEGCAQFVRTHPDCPLARKRLLQAILLPLAALIAAAVAACSVASGCGAYLGMASGGVLAALMAREVARTRRLEAVAYPFIALPLAAAFTLNLAKNLIIPKNPEAAVTQTWEETAQIPAAHARPSLARRAATRISWPLAALLALQAALSLSLVWSNTAFGDEANYLWGGQLEISHWLHGTPLPPSIAATYSGSPVIYPPIAAIANAVGGLAGARILSLIFMLIATTALYLTAKRLFGTAAAVAAAAVWSVSESCLRLAFATYDPMSVMLTALAVCLVVYAARSSRRGELLALAALSLGLANATAYSGLVADIGVFALAAVLWWREEGHRLALCMLAWFGAGAGAVFVGVLAFGHSWQGLLSTVIARAMTNDRENYGLILSVAWNSAGIVVVLAVLGLLLAVLRKDRANQMLLIVLAASGAAVAAAQLHEHTAWSLDKHSAYSIWLAAMGAGYAVSCFSRDGKVLLQRGIPLACCIGAVLIAVPAINGMSDAWSTYRGWQNSSDFIAAARPFADQTRGGICVSSAIAVAEYYLPQGRDWQRWGCSMSFNPALSVAQYSRSLVASNDGLIVLFYDTSLSSPQLPVSLLTGGVANAQGRLLSLVAAAASPPEPGLADLTTALSRDRAYRLVAVGPYDGKFSDGAFAIWQKTTDLR
jgi:hypothetical protein